MWKRSLIMGGLMALPLCGCGTSMGIQYAADPNNPSQAAVAMLPGGHAEVSELISAQCTGSPSCINNHAFVKTTTGTNGAVENIVLPTDSVATQTWAAVAVEEAGNIGADFLGGWAIGHFAPKPGNINVGASASAPTNVGVHTNVGVTASSQSTSRNTNNIGIVNANTNTAGATAGP